MMVFGSGDTCHLTSGRVEMLREGEQGGGRGRRGGEGRGGEGSREDEKGGEMSKGR